MKKKEADIISILECVRYFGGILEMSQELNISRSTIYYWLNGKRNPSKSICRLIELKTKGKFKYEDFIKK